MPRVVMSGKISLRVSPHVEIANRKIGIKVTAPVRVLPVVLLKDDQTNSTKGVAIGCDGMRNKCNRFLELRHRWVDCVARVIRAAKKSRNGPGDSVACLTIRMHGKCNVVGGSSVRAG